MLSSQAGRISVSDHPEERFDRLPIFSPLFRSGLPEAADSHVNGTWEPLLTSLDCVYYKDESWTDVECFLRVGVQMATMTSGDEARLSCRIAFTDSRGTITYSPTFNRIYAYYNATAAPEVGTGMTVTTGLPAGKYTVQPQTRMDITAGSGHTLQKHTEQEQQMRLCETQPYQTGS